MDGAKHSRPSPSRFAPGVSAAMFALYAITCVAEEHPLTARLQGGGLVIALASAEQGPGLGAPRPLPACPEGSRLTRLGWQHALAVGTGLRKQGVRVDLAYAGPGCAARHTAYLAFGADRVRHDPELAAGCTAGQAERHRRRAALVARLAARPTEPGTHLAVVVDLCNLRDLVTPEWPACTRALRPGDALLFDPANERTPRLVGCLPGKLLRTWSRRSETRDRTPGRGSLTRPLQGFTGLAGVHDADRFEPRPVGMGRFDARTRIP